MPETVVFFTKKFQFSLGKTSFAFFLFFLIKYNQNKTTGRVGVENMPQEGSFISYCGHGVCRIDGLRKMNFGKGEQDYLVIAPLRENGATIYLSADNPKIQTKIRPVLTKAEIDSVLAGIRSERMTWIEDRKARVARFQQILSQSEPRTLLLMAFCLQARREEKGLPSSELEILHKAQNIIEQEFSFALELPKQEIRQYIRERVLE